MDDDKKRGWAVTVLLFTFLLSIIVWFWLGLAASNYEYQPKSEMVRNDTILPLEEDE